MAQLSEQKILVVCDFTERMNEVIVHGARMAGILRKELCLLALWKDKKQKPEIQEKLSHLSRSLKVNLPDLQVSNLILKGTLENNIIRLVDEYNSVLVVLHQNRIKQSMRSTEMLRNTCNINRYWFRLITAKLRKKPHCGLPTLGGLISHKSGLFMRTRPIKTRLPG